MYRNDNSGCIGQIVLFCGLVFIGLVWAGVAALKENSAMRKARKTSTPTSYEQYLKEYPHGKYESEAHDSLVSILPAYPLDTQFTYLEQYVGTEFAPQLSEAIYRGIEQKPSLERWDYYILHVDKNYLKPEAFYKIYDFLYNAPESVQRSYIEKFSSTELFYLGVDPEARKAAAQVVEALTENVEAKYWNTEATAWRTASSRDDIASYSKYLELYPRGAHQTIAQKRLIDKEVERDFAGAHGIMPALQQTYSGSGTYSTIEVENETDYVMTILYSGQNSERIVINPRATRRFTLRNGSYRISARVTASNVIPYVGTITLSGGEYGASYYIVTE